MTVNIISLLVSTALIVFFAWLTRRAWGSPHLVLKWTGVVLAGMVTLILTVGTIFAVIGLIKFNTPQNNPVADIEITPSADQIARGNRLTNICASCHSTTGKPPLDGGKDSLTGPLGTLYPPNLTPAGDVKNWSDGEIIRAIREGVDDAGRGLIIMPSDQFHSLSDADVQDIVAYLRSQPAVTHQLPDNRLNLLGDFALGVGFLHTNRQPPITQPVLAPPAGTAEYGLYLIKFSGCQTCHGQDFAGGTSSFVPKGPDLTLVIPKWSESDFIQTIRTGIDPGGDHLEDTMPWKQFSAAYTDAELSDVYKYLHGLKPIQK
jgi:mono/diheme cytochrome c family protein